MSADLALHERHALGLERLQLGLGIHGHHGGRDQGTRVHALQAIDDANQTMDDAEVPPEGRILYVSSTVKKYLKQQITRLFQGEGEIRREVEMLDKCEVVQVPSGRFVTAATFYDGSNPAVGGYVKTGHQLNFLLVHPSAVLQATKIAIPKIFSPDENQTADAWKFQYRHYHDAFVYDNKVAGVYAHSASA